MINFTNSTTTTPTATPSSSVVVKTKNSSTVSDFGPLNTDNTTDSGSSVNKSVPIPTQGGTEGSASDYDGDDSADGGAIAAVVIICLLLVALAVVAFVHRERIADKFEEFKASRDSSGASGDGIPLDAPTAFSNPMYDESTSAPVTDGYLEVASTAEAGNEDDLAEFDAAFAAETAERKSAQLAAGEGEGDGDDGDYADMSNSGEAGANQPTTGEGEHGAQNDVIAAPQGDDTADNGEYDNSGTPSVDGNEAAAAATDTTEDSAYTSYSSTAVEGADNTEDGAYTSYSSGAVENVDAAEPVASNTDSNATAEVPEADNTGDIGSVRSIETPEAVEITDATENAASSGNTEGADDTAIRGGADDSSNTGTMDIATSAESVETR